MQLPQRSAQQIVAEIGKLVKQHITEQLLACGADIVEINTTRKRLSAVKGGSTGGFRPVIVRV